MAMPTMSPEERRKSFEQFELGYTERDALAEARRCLSCAAGAIVDEKKCESCLTCLRVCPFGVPAVDDVAVMCSEMCQSCGLCAVECPALAISIQRFAVGDIKQRVLALVEQTSEPVHSVELVCYQDAGSRDELQDRLVGQNGSLKAVVPVSCAARVEEVDMLTPFELDVDSVVVRRCEECRYRGAMDRLAKRVQRTQQLLAAAGFDGDRLTLE
jgi:ferredoxin